jgi:hypothetical protein
LSSPDGIDLFGFDWIPIGTRSPDKGQHILKRVEMPSGKLSDPRLNYYDAGFESAGYSPKTVQWFPVPSTD